MKVIIIGAGLGGLACAISCAQEGLEVILVERAPEILPIGAGIQVSSNATRIARELGILPDLLKVSIEPEALEMSRYENGKVLHRRAGREEVTQKYGAPWIVIHRADYHETMWNKAKSLGVDIRLNNNVESIDFEGTKVILSGGESLSGDVIVGADGLWSTTRDLLLGHPSPAVETGDLAYRGTFSAEQLRAFKDPDLDSLISRHVVTTWMGPEKHSVFYPLKGGREFNLVLIRPDNLPVGVRSAEGDLEEMRASFEGWDPRLTKIISCLDKVLKWKLCHHDELTTWTKGNVVLLGDACHPTLPYQGQGAAMAVEDGAVIGELLGLLNSNAKTVGSVQENIPEILKLYETLRKARTTLNVQGAVANKYWYHLADGPQQEARDTALAGGPDTTGWSWISPDYQMALVGFDSVADSKRMFQEWLSTKKNGTSGERL